MEALMLTDYLSDHGIEVESITPVNRTANTVGNLTHEERPNRLKDRGVRFNEEGNIMC